MEIQKKIMVLCGGKFAFKTLQLLAYENFICAIGIGKSNNSIIDALESEAQNNNLGFKSFPSKKNMEEMRDWIDSIKPDYIFCISFPFLIPESVLSYGTNKFINFHPAPLPQYRGPMPIFEVLKNQETETAICAHFMNEKFDEGNIIFNDTIKIKKNDTYGSLTMRLSDRLSQIALNMANMLQFANNIPNQTQDATLAYYYEKPELADTYINWKRKSAEEIISLINACNPWNSGADATLMDEQVKIIAAKLLDKPHKEVPGTIISIKKTIDVACQDNKQIAIKILSTDAGIMTAKQYKLLKPLLTLKLN
ncbi:formyltransferase family protein [Flavobacterium branchiarum]|uniref:Methionyl-tRNA formyltransferase n=1 Tax=Flavobacterium branchiarum TaxID=1114870 RepID=A0ABV5FQB7_9FLAO|nr:formyltransferase family protein [Flavobacterium branchiarum]MDN3674397.1 formyltransferase family protein [Flavobacterium branchiarum]